MVPPKESGAIRKNWSDQLRVALVYPNSYRVGMSNLGFQHVYHALNSSSMHIAERFFMESDRPSGARSSSRLLSVESSRPMRDFHVVAFSVPFENDYLNVPLILTQAGMEPLAQNRTSRDPLVISGGVSVSMNPEPLANFMDLFFIGELGSVEAPDGLFAALADMIARYGSTVERSFLIDRLRDCPGVYAPGAYTFNRDERGVLESISSDEGYPSTVKAVKSDWDSDPVPYSFVTTPDTEFSDTCLVEVNRGCSRRCRFCASGWIHSPVRYRGLDKIGQVVERATRSGLRLGLVGSDLAGHPQLEQIIELIVGNEGSFSLSSIRPEGLSGFMMNALARTGQKTATLAPEAASPRLKQVIGKSIAPELFYSRIEELVAVGIPNVRLYFMIGLPTETDDDVLEIVEFALKCREVFVDASRKTGRIGVLSVQVNPFIPKPWTPFQWAAVTQRNILEGRINILRNGLKKASNMSLRIEYGRDFFVQALLSRCDRDLGQRILDTGLKGKWTVQGLKKAGISLDEYIYRERSENEIFPWDIVDHGVSKQVLWKIYREATRSNF